MAPHFANRRRRRRRQVARSSHFVPYARRSRSSSTICDQQARRDSSRPRQLIDTRSVRCFPLSASARALAFSTAKAAANLRQRAFEVQRARARVIVSNNRNVATIEARRIFASASCSKKNDRSEMPIETPNQQKKAAAIACRQRPCSRHFARARVRRYKRFERRIFSIEALEQKKNAAVPNFTQPRLLGERLNARA